MDWDRMERNWTQFGGKVREKWSQLTDEEINAAAGSRNYLAERLMARYGLDARKAGDELNTLAMTFDGLHNTSKQQQEWKPL